MNSPIKVIFIVAVLTFAPLMGLALPYLDLLIPLAISFHVPSDGPPFSEAILPIFGSLNLLLGAVALLWFYLSGFRASLPIHIFRWFLIVYSSAALLIWCVFFGSRFFYFFPITNFVFYGMFASAIAPHVFWIYLLCRLRHWLPKQDDNKAKQLSRPVE